MPEHDAPWTPGPWTAACFMVKAGADVITQTGYSSTLGPPRAREAEANARLIAAAPALYECTVEALAFMESLIGVQTAHPKSRAAGLLKQFRAALALARGETNG